MRSDSQVLLVQSHDLVNKRMFLKCLFAWKLSVSAPHKYYYRFAFCIAKTIMLLLCAVVFLPRQNKGQDLPSQLPICNKNLWYRRDMYITIFLFRKIRKSCFYKQKHAVLFTELSTALPSCWKQFFHIYFAPAKTILLTLSHKLN